MTDKILNSSAEQAIAKVLAFKFHAGQWYGVHSYTYHLEMVAESVKIAFPNDDRLVSVAYLHDILEDTNCPEAALAALFEDNIVAAVVALTKREGEAKEQYIARVKANDMALKVKKHDALCNLTESLRRQDSKRIKKYANLVQQLEE